MTSARRVAVTGLGLVNPFGGDLPDFFGRMLRGESAIRLYTREDDVLRPLSVPAVRCADFDAEAALGRSLSYTMDRYSQLGTAAALSAWRDAGLPRTKEAMRILALGDEASAVRACRPFSSDRQGLVLGEGAGAMILEDWDHAVRRGARIYAEFAGCGSTSDHDHLVRPNVDGQTRAMCMAIQDGRMTPDEIDYINAHGTATREGDPIEIAAIRGVFGSRSAAVAVSATKSMHGHMLVSNGVN